MPAKTAVNRVNQRPRGFSCHAMFGVYQCMTRVVKLKLDNSSIINLKHNNCGSDIPIEIYLKGELGPIKSVTI